MSALIARVHLPLPVPVVPSAHLMQSHVVLRTLARVSTLPMNISDATFPFHPPFLFSCSFLFLSTFPSVVDEASAITTIYRLLLSPAEGASLLPVHGVIILSSSPAKLYLSTLMIQHLLFPPFTADKVAIVELEMLTSYLGL